MPHKIEANIKIFAFMAFIRGRELTFMKVVPVMGIYLHKCETIFKEHKGLKTDNIDFHDQD